MNLGSSYSYPAGARVTLGGVNYYSLVGSNTTTPPGASWAVDFSAHSGAFTAGHLAVFADTKGTIQDGGAVPSAYTLPAATTSVLGGVIPDGTIITVDGSGHITVPTATSSVLGVVKPDGTIITDTAGVITVAKASNSAFGVVEVDNTSITASSGVISTGFITPAAVRSLLLAEPNTGTFAAGTTTTGSNLIAVGKGSSSGWTTDGTTTYTGTWKALQDAGSASSNIGVLWQRIA